jgi:hypothetical protein
MKSIVLDKYVIFRLAEMVILLCSCVAQVLLCKAEILEVFFTSETNDWKTVL